MLLRLHPFLVESKTSKAFSSLFSLNFIFYHFNMLKSRSMATKREPGIEFVGDSLTLHIKNYNEPWNRKQAFDQVLPITPPSEEINSSYFYKPEEVAFSPVTNHETPLVAVIGVGYVGLHLVQAFSRCYNVIAFDTSKDRLLSVADQFSDDTRVTLTSDASQLAAATHFLVSVPTLLVPGTSVVDTSYLRSALDTISVRARVGSTYVDILSSNS